MPNFYFTTLQCDRAIVPTLGYNKWTIIWCFVSVCRLISEHEFISDFVVVVKYFTIFVDIIFIILRLLSLTY